MNQTVIIRQLDVLGPDETIDRLGRIVGLKALHSGQREFQLYDTWNQALARTGYLAFQDGQGLTLAPWSTLLPQNLPMPRGVDHPTSPGPSPLASQNWQGWKLLPGPRIGISNREYLACQPNGKGVARLSLCTIRGPHTRHCLVFRQVLGYDAEARQLRQAVLQSTGSFELPSIQVLLSAVLGLKPEHPRPAPPEKDSPSWLVWTITRALEEAFEQVPGILGDLDEECLHQYRVRLRAARSLLGLFRPWLSDLMPRLKEVLAALMTGTNRLRDLDVLLGDMKSYRKLLGPKHSEGTKAMANHFTRERNRALEVCRAWMAGSEWQELRDTALRYCAPHSPLWLPLHTQTSFKALAWNQGARVYKKILECGAALSQESPPREVHHLRILHKRLRYLLEELAKADPKSPARQILPLLKDSQKYLGNFCDLEVQHDFFSLASLEATEGLGSEGITAIGALVTRFEQLMAESLVTALAHNNEAGSPQIRILIATQSRKENKK